MTTNTTKMVHEYKNYTLVVGFSPRAQQDLFQLINTAWGVIAFETPSEQQAREIGALLDDLYGKPEADANADIEYNLTKSH